MPPKKERKPLKTDAVSIIVYIVIGVLLYYIIGILTKITYYLLAFPLTIQFRDRVFVQNPLAIILNIIFALLYSQFLIFIVNFIFVVVIVCVAFIYIIWSIFKDIFIIGAIIRASFPFKEFDEAGIFTLIDNIWLYISKVLPSSILKASILIYAELLLFAKNKIVDFVLLANPEAKVGGETIDEVVAKLKESSGVESFENIKKPNNVFFERTKEMIEQKQIADAYKTTISVKPNMDMSDRMYISFQNELNKMQMPLNNIENITKNEVAAATFNVE